MASTRPGDEPRLLFRARTREELSEHVDSLLRNLRGFPKAYQIIIFADERGLWWGRAHGWRERRLAQELAHHEVGYYNRTVSHAELLDDVLYLARSQGWLQEES